MRAIVNVDGGGVSVCMCLHVFFHLLFMKHTNLMFRLLGHFNKSSSLRVRDACASFLAVAVFVHHFRFLCVVLWFTVFTGFSHQPCDKDLRCDEFCLVLRKLQHFLQPAVARFHTLHRSSIALAVNVRFPGVEQSGIYSSHLLLCKKSL